MEPIAMTPTRRTRTCLIRAVDFTTPRRPRRPPRAARASRRPGRRGTGSLEARRPRPRRRWARGRRRTRRRPGAAGPPLQPSPRVPVIGGGGEAALRQAVLGLECAGRFPLHVPDHPAEVEDDGARRRGHGLGREPTPCLRGSLNGLSSCFGAVTATQPRRFIHSSSRLLPRSEEHTSELQSRSDLVCRLLLEKKKKKRLLIASILCQYTH